MLQNEQNKRNLAMFDLAINSKLGGCDVVTIKVNDIAPNGYAIQRAIVRKRKTGRPFRFELTEHTRQAGEDYLKSSRKKLGEFLFTSLKSGCSMKAHELSGQTRVGLVHRCRVRSPVRTHCGD